VRHARAGTLLASTLFAACSWHAEGMGGALREPPAGVPTPAVGMDVAGVLEVARAREAGGVDVDLRELHVSRVTDGVWEAVSPDEAVRDPGAELAVVAVRRCGDWTGREHWESGRASWFVLQRGALAAFDHWSFGPRCAVGNAFAPAPAPLLETERTLRRFVDQRHPPAPPPLSIQLRRGLAYLAAGRVQEARAQLAAGDQRLAARQDLYEETDATPLEQETFRLESEELYALREELSAALARQRREAARAP
jgi:hypothetical protein